MLKSISRRALVLHLCTLFIATSTPAPATKAPRQVPSPLSTPRPAPTCTGFLCAFQRGSKWRQVAAAIVGVVAVGIVATVLVVHYKPAKVKGCLASGPNGFELASSSDKLTYELTGDTSGLKPGEMFKLKGKKKRIKGTDNMPSPSLSSAKSYGACPITPNP